MGASGHQYPRLAREAPGTPAPSCPGIRCNRPGGAPDSTVALFCELRGPLVPPLPSRAPVIADRIGIDLAPIDAGDPEAALWLRACVWPEQRDRAARLRLALAVARSARLPLVAGDAVDALPAAIAALPREIPIPRGTRALLCASRRAGQRPGDLLVVERGADAAPSGGGRANRRLAPTRSGGTRSEGRGPARPALAGAHGVHGRGPGRTGAGDG